MVYDIELVDVMKQFSSGGKRVIAVDNIDLQIEQGEFFALLGPSGCGKTTTLRMIAGFEQPTSGRVLIRGEAMQDVPPFHRPVNTVFQDYALFPHMTILKNVMFGLEMEGVSKDAARQRARDALQLVQLPDMDNRKPNQLSGGQQQRVALARALVKSPAVLLLDEPLGALDLKLRKQMQYELKSMQKQVGITFIYVTHDQEEAMTMADRIAVMNKGNVLQVGTPRQIYEQPESRFVADFIGETNFIRGTLEDRTNGTGVVRLAEQTIIHAQLPEHITPDRGEVSIPVRPERVGLLPPDATPDYPEAGELTVLKGRVVDVQYIGTDTRYTVKISGNNEIVARIQNVDYAAQHDFQPGDEVNVFWALKSTYILDH
jgi:spermidine/putrescine transport system ATP-binding protein